eukprot:m.141707 g.141707  ORF g.141707 m.141707 type:complete len:137 (+) comp24162_c0_seq1:71-481(+)
MYKREREAATNTPTKKESITEFFCFRAMTANLSIASLFMSLLGQKRTRKHTLVDTYAQKRSFVQYESGTREALEIDPATRFKLPGCPKPKPESTHVSHFATQPSTQPSSMDQIAIPTKTNSSLALHPGAWRQSCNH